MAMMRFRTYRPRSERWYCSCEGLRFPFSEGVDHTLFAPRGAARPGEGAVRCLPLSAPLGARENPRVREAGSLYRPRHGPEASSLPSGRVTATTEEVIEVARPVGFVNNLCRAHGGSILSNGCASIDSQQPLEGRVRGGGG
jgi:predicted outer membrane repeat protein